MNISLDFDDTYTRDPVFWNRFIEMAWEFRHDVYCITAREPSRINQEEVYESIGKLIGKDHCLFTSSLAKAKYAADHSVHIDVWIDDLPSNVDNNKRLFADFKNTDFPY
jgi:hypothetical protein